MQTVVNELLTTTADVVPSGVIYKLKGEKIREYLLQYLKNKDVVDINKIYIGLKKERSTRIDEVVIYLFIDEDSPQLKSSVTNIPDRFRDKVEKSYVGLSSELERALSPIMGNHKSFGMTRNGSCYIRLDIFRVLSLMLSANRTQYSLSILDTVELGDENDVMMSVAKVIRYKNPSNNSMSDDRYKKIVEELEDMNS